MIIDNKKFELACAKKCLPVSKIFAEARISTCVLQKIKRKENLKAFTVGKICKALGCDPAELIAE